MTNFPRARVVVLVLMLASPATASALDDYRNWDQTPEALFITQKERLDWKKVRTDEDAERFVAAYMSRRGKAFKAELHRRIEMADRYLTTGDTPGSETLRGKVVIVMGAPSRIEREGGFTVRRPENSSMSGIYTNVGPMNTGSTSHNVTPVVYTFRYAGDEVEQQLRRQELVLRIEIDSETGNETLIEEKGAPTFEEISRRVAELSVTPSEEGSIRIADFH